MINVILADDDPIVLRGLEMIIGTQKDMTVLATALNGKEAVALCRKLRPDVALLDIRMRLSTESTRRKLFYRSSFPRRFC
jgi:YesN/AraC family two-component response regulator